QVKRKYPRVEKRRLIAEIIRAMINTLVIDLTENTLANIRQHKPGSVDEVRSSPMLASFSPSIRSQADALKSFLFENLYRHYRVVRMSTMARAIVRELFVAFVDEPRRL